MPSRRQILRLGSLTLLGILLIGNAVPIHPAELESRAELIADVTIVQPYALTQRRQQCLVALAKNVIKGQAQGPITICETGIREFDPRRPRKGDFLRVYLQRHGQTFYPFSYASFSSRP